MTKTEHLIEGKHRDRGVICYRTGFECHAHYGGIPSGSICIAWSHLPAVYRRRIFSIQKTLKQSRKTQSFWQCQNLCVYDLFLESRL